MDCIKAQTWIQRAIDGQLTQEQWHDLKAHLQQCPQCASLYQQYLALDALLAEELQPVAAPADLSQQVMAALPQSPLTVLRPRRWVRFVRRGVVAAAIALIVASGWHFVDLALEGWGQAPTISKQESGDRHAFFFPIVADPNGVSPTQEPEDIPSGEEDDNAGNESVISPPPETDPQPPVSAEDEDPVFTGAVPLPEAALGNDRVIGSFSLVNVASYAVCDALVPRIHDDGTIDYYIYYDGQYHKLQIVAGSQIAEDLGVVSQLPSPTTNMQVNALPWLFGENTHYSAVSPDGQWLAINGGGTQTGLWVLPAAQLETIAEANSPYGGGRLLAWSPDGNKVLYTTATGSLRIYYLTERRDIELYAEAVSAIYWSSNSRTVVFAGWNAETGYDSIYKIMVP